MSVWRSFHCVLYQCVSTAKQRIPLPREPRGDRSRPRHSLTHPFACVHLDVRWLFASRRGTISNGNMSRLEIHGTEGQATALPQSGVTKVTCCVTHELYVCTQCCARPRAQTPRASVPIAPFGLEPVRGQQHLHLHLQLRVSPRGHPICNEAETWYCTGLPLDTWRYRGVQGHRKVRRALLIRRYHGILPGFRFNNDDGLEDFTLPS